MTGRTGLEARPKTPPAFVHVCGPLPALRSLRLRAYPNTPSVVMYVPLARSLRYEISK